MFRLVSVVLMLYCCVINQSHAESDRLLISTSRGVYEPGKDKPVITKTFKNNFLTAFKTEVLPDGRVLVAWGIGRMSFATDQNQVAILELVNLNKLEERKELVKTSGLRIRDFVVDGENVVAGGHFNGNVHYLSLKTGKQNVIHVSSYDGAIIHAVEKADLDGDGKNEYYLTVTSPNVAGGLGQEGKIIRVDVDWETFHAESRTVVDLFEMYSSYAREIAITDLDGDGKPELVIQVSPQIEVYGEGDLSYNEPMRLISAEYTKEGKYKISPLAEANIRLGRTLSYEDIDNDKHSELYFADFYMTGIYVLEAKSEKIRASGEKVNLLESDFDLTRIQAKPGSNNNQAMFDNLKSNQLILADDKKSLWVISDSSHYPDQQPAKNETVLPLRLLNYQIVIDSNGYSLKQNSSTGFVQTGFAWHIFLMDR